jgi:hypothetical protein
MLRLAVCEPVIAGPKVTHTVQDTAAARVDGQLLDSANEAGSAPVSPIDVRVTEAVVLFVSVSVSKVLAVPVGWVVLNAMLEVLVARVPEVLATPEVPPPPPQAPRSAKHPTAASKRNFIFMHQVLLETIYS